MRRGLGTGLVMLAVCLLALACSGGAPAIEYLDGTKDIGSARGSFSASLTSRPVAAFPDGRFTLCPDFRDSTTVRSYQPDPLPAPGVDRWYYRWSYWAIRMRYLQVGDDVSEVTRAFELSFWYAIASEEGQAGLAANGLPAELTFGDALDLAWLSGVMAAKEEAAR